MLKIMQMLLSHTYRVHIKLMAHVGACMSVNLYLLRFYIVHAGLLSVSSGGGSVVCYPMGGHVTS